MIEVCIILISFCFAISGSFFFVSMWMNVFVVFVHCYMGSFYRINYFVLLLHFFWSMPSIFHSPFVSFEIYTSLIVGFIPVVVTIHAMLCGRGYAVPIWCEAFT